MLTIGLEYSVEFLYSDLLVYLIFIYGVLLSSCRVTMYFLCFFES